MKKIVLLFLVSLLALTASAQKLGSNYKGKKVVVKEWKTSEKNGVRYLDQKTVYNAKNQKVEQTEYANYGQTSRTTYEYDANGRCVKQVVYDSKDKVYRIRKFEYYSDGSKKKQLNYSPSGKLISTREFEYVFE
ncbi:MAG: hypothetical protein MJZ76_02235 [Bacteroidales bacterium]|nr:hypothetical protein [Bacteroidales bacterium]